MEKNRNILLRALKNLPDYTPQDNVWEGVATKLENEQISGLVGRMSTFEPPESIWDNIDKELTSRQAIHSKKGLYLWMKWISATAATFVLGYFLFFAGKTGNTKLHYSVEYIKTNNIQQWFADDLEFEQALALVCNEKPKICESPEFKNMEKKLDFLNQSKQQIVKQLSKYDNDSDMEIMLTKIELERTSLINQMIAKVN